MTNTTTEPTATQHGHFPLAVHIETPHRWHMHHGIYVGAGQVVYYQGLSSPLRRGAVAKVSLAEFTHGHPVRVHDEREVAYSGIEVGARAYSRLGEYAYFVLRINYETFCSWCLIGADRSPQVERLLSTSRAIAFAAQTPGRGERIWID